MNSTNDSSENKTPPKRKSIVSPDVRVNNRHSALLIIREDDPVMPAKESAKKNTLSKSNRKSVSTVGRQDNSLLPKTTSSFSNKNEHRKRDSLPDSSNFAIDPLIYELNQLGNSEANLYSKNSIMGDSASCMVFSVVDKQTNV